MTLKKCEISRRGRPPAFDRQKALIAAMHLFWDRGYEGTSFDDLIDVMNISASSFYNSFKSKENLYEEAIAAYLGTTSQWFLDALAEKGDTRHVFGCLLEAAAEQFTREGLPTGCMIAVAATQCSPSQLRIRDLISAHRRNAEEAMLGRLHAGISAGEIGAGAEAEIIAGFLGSVLCGMAVQARDGASREKLRGIAQMSMAAWPGCVSTATAP